MYIIEVLTSKSNYTSIENYCLLGGEGAHYMIRHSEITQCQIQNFWVNYIHFTPPREDLEENSLKRNVIV